MYKTIIAEGKTTTEAIENGLKQLKTSKENVNIKVLESEEKRSFFSILEPRKVRVEIALKEDKAKQEKLKVEINREREIKYDSLQMNVAKKNIEIFLKEFLKSVAKEAIYSIKEEEGMLHISIEGKDISKLIGYRGDTLNSFQTIISSIANKHTEDKVKVLLDIGGYRRKRRQTLESLAENMAKRVERTARKVTLEPMSSYERKIIHSKLQDNNEITTYSIGEEPYRKVVITKK